MFKIDKSKMSFGCHCHDGQDFWSRMIHLHALNPDPKGFAHAALYFGDTSTIDGHTVNDYIVGILPKSDFEVVMGVLQSAVDAYIEFFAVGNQLKWLQVIGSSERTARFPLPSTFDPNTP